MQRNKMKMEKIWFQKSYLINRNKGPNFSNSNVMGYGNALETNISYNKLCFRVISKLL